LFLYVISFFFPQKKLKNTDPKKEKKSVVLYPAASFPFLSHFHLLLFCERVVDRPKRERKKMNRKIRDRKMQNKKKKKIQEEIKDQVDDI